jgi:hypothetical protein
LLAAGHDVASVPAQWLSGRPTEKIYAVCLAERRILVTLDLDFSNPLRFPCGKCLTAAGTPRGIRLRQDGCRQAEKCGEEADLLHTPHIITAGAEKSQKKESTQTVHTAH